MNYYYAESEFLFVGALFVLQEINSIAEALGSFAVSVVTLDNSTLNEPKQVVEHVLVCFGKNRLLCNNMH